MRTHIENDIYLSGDRLNFTVEKMSIKPVKDKKTGVVTEQEVYDAMGYYTNLSQAATALLKFKMADSTSTDLKELLAEAKAYREFIQSKIEI